MVEHRHSGAKVRKRPIRTEALSGFEGRLDRLAFLLCQPAIQDRVLRRGEPSQNRAVARSCLVALAVSLPLLVAAFCSPASTCRFRRRWALSPSGASPSSMGLSSCRMSAACAKPQATVAALGLAPFLFAAGPRLGSAASPRHCCIQRSDEFHATNAGGATGVVRLFRAQGVAGNRRWTMPRPPGAGAADTNIYLQPVQNQNSRESRQPITNPLVPVCHLQPAPA